MLYLFRMPIFVEKRKVQFLIVQKCPIKTSEHHRGCLAAPADNHSLKISSSKIRFMLDYRIKKAMQATIMLVFASFISGKKRYPNLV